MSVPASRPRNGFRRRPAAALLLLFAAATLRGAPAIPCVWTGVERIVAVGDVHGDFDNFTSILRRIGLVDEELRWTGGTTHLVQVGDVMDRGDGARAILDLMMRLEKEAEAAGGKLHMLLGNHEETNITGIALDYPDYVPLAQFLSFLPADFRARREKDLLSSLPENGSPAERSTDPDLNPEAERYWKRQMATVDGRAAYAKGFADPYGKWLLRCNTVIRIDDTIFVHGGISEKFAAWPLEKINEVMRQELAFVRDQIRFRPEAARVYRPRIVYDPEGPLWFRDLALADEATGRARIERILAAAGAKRMVVGHTYARNGTSSPIISLRSVNRYDGRLWIIDTGISSRYGGAMTALISDEEGFRMWGLTEEPPPVPQVPRVATPATPPSDEEMDGILRAAPVSGIRREALPGRTESWMVTLLAPHGEVRAVFKSVDRRRPNVLPDSWKYEAAAGVLARLLDFPCVPPVVEREIDGRAGSLQVFVEGAASLASVREKQLSLSPDTATAVQGLAVFENLAFSVSEDGRDVLIRKSDGHVYRIDFSEAFAPVKQFVPGRLPERCPRGVYARLQAWDDASMRAALGGWLDEDELAALSARRELVAARLKELIAEKGEAAVLY